MAKTVIQPFAPHFSKSEVAKYSHPAFHRRIRSSALRLTDRILDLKNKHPTLKWHSRVLQFIPPSPMVSSVEDDGARSVVLMGECKLCMHKAEVASMCTVRCLRCKKMNTVLCHKCYTSEWLCDECYTNIPAGCDIPYEYLPACYFRRMYSVAIAAPKACVEEQLVRAEPKQATRKPRVVHPRIQFCCECGLCMGAPSTRRTQCSDGGARFMCEKCVRSNIVNVD